MEQPDDAISDVTQTRTVPRFAWIPVRACDGGWIFLESYDSVEWFERDYGAWATGHWLVSERRRRR